MLFGLGSRRAAEAGGTDGRATHAGGAGDELEEVEGDVFVAAGAEAGGGKSVHRESFSEKDANRNGMGSADGAARRALVWEAMRRAFIGMGANLRSRAGDPAETLSAAAAALGALGRVTARSSLYRTAPVGYAEQPQFTNAVAELETGLSPLTLLEHLMEIERQFGRDRRLGFLNGPRTLDLDVLMVGDLCVGMVDLLLPHPRLTERAFVLVPLNEIAPRQRVPPGNASVAELLDRLRKNNPGDADAVVPMESCAWSAAVRGGGGDAAGRAGERDADG